MPPFSKSGACSVRHPKLEHSLLSGSAQQSVRENQQTTVNIHAIGSGRVPQAAIMPSTPPIGRAVLRSGAGLHRWKRPLDAEESMVNMACAGPVIVMLEPN